MLFNSLEFPIFLAIVLSAYWLLKNQPLKYQNLLVLVASYVFYGWWDWRFLSLIFLSSAVDFIVGWKIFQSTNTRTRRILLLVSLSMNLGALGVFKYFNFFIDSLAVMIESIGLQANLPTLHVILPVGISFYTFQTLSYAIDIHNKKMEPVDDAIAFFSFVAFFPQLVAGPIERASNLLPQFLERRTVTLFEIRSGLRQMLWGFFKKVAVADMLAPHVNQIFADPNSFDSGTLIVGILFFAFQIYSDFSGYSDIAIGTARLFGFNLMQNFAYPYFSRNIAEFWRRWHISLSSWFRDYVYIPLGGSRSTFPRKTWNILVTFTVSGFWHGANWTFVIWGFLNGAYYIPLMLMNKTGKHDHVVAHGKWFPTVKEVVSMLGTFALALLAWTFFRASSVSVAIQYIGRIFAHPGVPHDLSEYLIQFYLLGVLLLMEWWHRDRPFGLDFQRTPIPIRWAIYMFLALNLLVFGMNAAPQEFIYFQF